MIKHMINYKVIFVVLFFLILMAPNSIASSISGVDFQDRKIVDGTQLELKGVGLKKVILFKKAFVAGFYLGEDISVENVFDDVAKQIEVSYFVSIPGERLSDFTEELMKENSTPQEFTMISDRVKIMREYFVDLNPGDRYMLTYIPQTGTKFHFNGSLVGVIKGNDFAKSLFSTWIGKNPFDKKLRNQILGL